jgi:2-oxoglutarate ferredoxin oxidoreductase subunit alpha
MTDLDIGMNQRLTRPFVWDDAREFDRGKVMTHEQLEAGQVFGRYNDVDGDGIPYRTYPGTHPNRGAYFTRGTTKDRFARYSEAGPDYVENVTRLLRKFETARKLVPPSVLKPASQKTRFGVIYFGSTSPAMAEASDVLEADGIHADLLRVRGFPFDTAVERFLEEHDTVFVVEQNRDGQMRSMIINELDASPSAVVPILHFDGTPITARFIVREIGDRIRGSNVEPITRGKAA